MASLRSNRNMVVVMVVTVMVAAATMNMVLTVSGAECPAQGELVYPYWSLCWSPAVYYGKEVYELAAGTGDVSGSLAPEYDETNSTYYLRLADVGAKYKLTHITYEYRPYVAQSHDVVFINVETGRTLGWRQEADDELFLVEGEGGARFQFTTAGVGLACPRIAGARCEAYYVVDFANSSLGLSPYVEDGATYFKQGSDQGLPFTLLRSSSSVLAAPA